MYYNMHYTFAIICVCNYLLNIQNEEAMTRSILLFVKIKKIIVINSQHKSRLLLERDKKYCYILHPYDQLCYVGQKSHYRNIEKRIIRVYFLKAFYILITYLNVKCSFTS